jgi:oxepin-CoA hydrolase/3-oxo-5,6-dehydrosuberyl-CoA semialdehyde dehydrogenase
MTDAFDVDDAGLRDRFLRNDLTNALADLDAASTPLWGSMSPQEMLEHLLWALEVSTGRATVECSLTDAEIARALRFLYSDMPSPREFMNPALADGLPPLRYEDLDEARAALVQELTTFLDMPVSEDRLLTHPVFGPLDHEQWHRAHYKHAHHHLLQFGLIESE